MRFRRNHRFPLLRLIIPSLREDATLVGWKERDPRCPRSLLAGGAKRLVPIILVATPPPLDTLLAMRRMEHSTTHSRESGKREIGTGSEKSASSGRTHSRESGHKHKEESSSSIKTQRKGDKKKMKKVVYYETDSSSPSTSGSESASATSKRHEGKKYSKMPLRYPCISKRTPLLSVPLGKPPVFDGEDYSMWSDKMRHHLTSLHKSIWDIVEYGAQVSKEGDKDYNSEEVEQIRHFNSQATTIHLASLSREEYNRVQGLKSAKEIWDVLKEMR
jgi:hypothetical protein